ncbi:MAG: NAD(P)-dependent dehydrogenase (short-subunit alcohol dehydrogenase family) [Candidatus Azotimanducaceae bacterium]|jgi:NAD(P)-dependent dehydrogenase (short-subunit alcohol dehydrogenase family)
MQNFDGRVAVITGGASGIGLGMARSFAQRGMKLVLADLDDAALKNALKEFGDAGVEVVGRRCDVSKLEEVEALAELATTTYGSVNVLCNNAGVGIPTSARKMKLADWKWIIDVDLWGPIYGLNVFLPLIEEAGEGHVNSTSSMAGLISSQMMGAYNVAKHGVVALMAATERELRAKDSPITASVLCPGPINTNISRHSVEFRPGKAKPKADGPNAGKMASSIQASLEAGMQPDEVGELVFDAIKNDKFWILTHPWWAKGVQRQLDALVNDQTLTKA